MLFGSVCSGIEAASVAWAPLGWKAAFLSEIEPFPCKLLKHYYPDIPNLGDMTKFKEWPDYAIDLLAGGTPCQGFSAAGLRGGLDDDRSKLSLTYCEIAARYRPNWLVWENVPGVFSSAGGCDFATFLGLLCGRKLGVPEGGWQSSGVVQGYGNAYGIAWRVLDAQFAGLAQRRKRVFVVGYLGDWRRAAAVLFERESLRWNPAPSRKAGEGITYNIAPCLDSSGTGFSRTGDIRGQDPVVAVWPAETAPTLDAHFGDKLGLENQHINSGGGYSCPPVSMCLNAGAMGRIDAESETLITTRGFPDDAVPINTQLGLRGADTSNSDREGIGIGNVGDPMFTLQHSHCHAVQLMSAVRRLTPQECERLMGFTDGYTLIPVGKKMAADGPRYKALGNSWAVPVARWIGERIQMVDSL